MGAAEGLRKDVAAQLRELAGGRGEALAALAAARDAAGRAQAQLRVRGPALPWIAVLRRWLPSAKRACAHRHSSACGALCLRSVAFWSVA